MPPTGEIAHTGIEGLDEILLGGLPRDRVYLVQGAPGVGKTTMALQFLLRGVADGEPGLYVTLSETREEVEQVAASHGWSLDGLAIFELSAMKETVELDVANTLFESGDVELQEITQALLARVAEVEPRRVVFDSLSELRLLSQSSLRYRRQVLALKHYFATHRATVLLLDDGTGHGHDLQLQSLAHGVISLEQSVPVYGDDRRRLRIVKLRGLRFRSGHHDFAIQKGGMHVFPRLAPAHASVGFAGQIIPSGVANLDQLLGGGIHRGTSTLIMGPAGSGKSIIAMQYAVAAAERGDNAVIFVFEENLGTLFARSSALGINLDGHIRAGRIEVRRIDPAVMGPGEFAHVASTAAHANDAKVIVVDSLNSYLAAMPSEQMLAVQMHELLSVLAQRGVTTLLTLAQHGMLSRAEPPVDVSYLADTVVMLRFFEAAGRIRKAISVVKKRSGPHEDTIRSFSMSRAGVNVGPALTAFTGVLTGTPRYQGDVAELSDE